MVDMNLLTFWRVFAVERLPISTEPPPTTDNANPAYESNVFVSTGTVPVFVYPRLCVNRNRIHAAIRLACHIGLLGKPRSGIHGFNSYRRGFDGSASRRRRHNRFQSSCRGCHRRHSNLRGCNRGHVSVVGRIQPAAPAAYLAVAMLDAAIALSAVCDFWMAAIAT